MSLTCLERCRALFCFLSLVFLPLGVQAQEDKLDIKAESALTDLRSSFNSIESVRVTVTNRGRDAVGSVELNAGMYRMTYPIDLPGGSVKRFFAYLPSQSSSFYGERTKFVLHTNQGSVQQFYENERGPSDSANNMLYVGDQIGSMTFLRQAKKKTEENEPGPIVPGRVNAFQDVYCKPGMVPTRAIAFQPLAAVVMGEGSERLTDTEVKAIQSYVLGGGVVIFPGGVSAPALSDPRWADYVPVTGARPITMAVPGVLAQFSKNPFGGRTLSILASTPVPGSRVQYDKGVPIIASRGFGMGKVVFLACSPFEPPLDTWEGRANLMINISRRPAGASAFMYLSNFNNDPMRSSSSMSGGSISSSGMVRYPSNQNRDPFNVKLPRVSVVVMILIAYMLIVVPVNLVILRKVHRSEWAWWTTPIISLVFAGIFFQYASDLYTAKLSTISSGLLVMDDRCDTGYFVGQTQMFFPKGGRYDLGLKNVEIVLPQEQDEMGVRGPTSRSVIDAMSPIDIGEVRVPEMQVNNLSFHEFGYCQTIPTPKWIGANLSCRSDLQQGTISYQLKGSITNRSPYRISGDLSWKALRLLSINLQPGETLEINNRFTVQQGQERVGPLIRATDAGLAIVGTLEGFRPGPTIGTPAPNNGRIDFIAVLGSVAISEAK